MCPNLGPLVGINNAGASPPLTTANLDDAHGVGVEVMEPRSVIGPTKVAADHSDCVGATIDVAGTFLESTDGYAAMWLIVGLPVLLAIPLVVKLARVEPRAAAEAG